MTKREKCKAAMIKFNHSESLNCFNLESEASSDPHCHTRFQKHDTHDWLNRCPPESNDGGGVWVGMMRYDTVLRYVPDKTSVFRDL